MIDFFVSVWSSLLTEVSQIYDLVRTIPIVRVVLALGIWSLFVFIRIWFERRVVDKVHAWAEKSAFRYDEQLVPVLKRPLSVLIMVLGFYFSLKIIDFDQWTITQKANDLINQILKIITAMIAVWVTYRLSDVFASFIDHHLRAKDEAIRRQFIPLLRKSIKTCVLIVGSLLIFQNLGYSVATLMTGLGIGGLAIALAAQETLANFFGSIMLLTDIPFRVDDWVSFKNVEGVVESVGFRTTRIRTFEKSLITVPNKIFMSTPIENFTTRNRRRIRMNISLTYDTKVEKIAEFVRKLKEKLDEHPKIHDDFSIVSFDEFQSSALNILIYCFTKTIVAIEYRAIRQELNFSIMRLAESLEVSFAFPSRTIYLGNDIKHKKRLKSTLS